MSYLYLALHYPKPEHSNDLLLAMQRLNDALHDASGLLQIGAWREDSSTRIVALSIWESQQAFQDALGLFASVVANVPFAEWEQRPRELIRATEIRLPT